MEIKRSTLFFLAILIGLSGVGVTVAAISPEADSIGKPEPVEGLPDNLDDKAKRLDVTAELSIQNQTLANYFIIDRVTIDRRGGFVILYQLNRGVPEVLVGASPYLPVGSRTNTKIELLRYVNPGDELLAILHYDNNGDRVFEAEADPPVYLSANQILMAKFVVQPKK